MSLRLRNTYYALRHGISVANEEGIIISHPENAIGGWGLSDMGREHCREVLAPDRLLSFAFSPADTITISSDFRRAHDTAEVFSELNRLPAPTLDARLRERFFGDLEHQSQQTYLEVWERDVHDPDHSLHGCESTGKVAARLRQLLDETESRYCDKKIVLVSHGDPLQILETIFVGLPSNHHRTLVHLGNADIRELVSGT